MAEKSEINAQENQESLSQLMATQVEELEMCLVYTSSDSLVLYFVLVNE